MKKFLSLLAFLLLLQGTYGQDISIMLKLYDLSEKLGTSPKTQVDTQYLKAVKTLMSLRTENQLELLWKSGQYFLNHEYVHMGFYIRQVDENFKEPEFRKIKLLLVLFTYANEQEALRTAKCYSLARKDKLMEKGNFEIIDQQIRDNFDRETFEDALSHYYSSRDRKKILEEIYKE
jgi:hypothetical protein